MPPRSRTTGTSTETTAATEPRAEETSEARAAEGPTTEGEGREERADGGRPAGRRGLPLGLPRALDPKRLLWLGGLAALAAIEIIEWPVALAIGAGTVVAERLAVEHIRKQSSGRREERAEGGDRDRTEAEARA